MVVSGKDKRSIRMKKLVVVAMAAAALAAAAMPTEEEFAKASKDVQAALKAQIASWQRGEIADGDLAALMLMKADKFKDEARHYACLQAAFAAAARANDAALAAKALTRMKSEVSGFSSDHERQVIDKAIAKAKMKNAADFRRLIKRKVASVCSSAAEIDMVERMKRIEIPVLDFKPPMTLPEVVGYFHKQSIAHGDPTKPKGERGISFMLKGNLAGRAVPKIRATNISLYDALDLVCQATDTCFSFSEVDKVIVVIESTRDEDLESGKGTHDIVHFRPPVPRADAEIGLVGRMKRIMIPSVSFKPPATVADAIEFFRKQSVEHDDPTLPAGKRGMTFILKTGDDGSLAKTALPKISAKEISLYNIFNLVCEATGLKYSFGKNQEIVVEQMK